jgi:ABC-type uncharacterized transport system substrate-binding protein
MLQYNIIKTLARKIVRPLKCFLFLACSGLFFFRITPAHAHPHAWIDVQSEILFDTAGNITGLRETWLFDEFYTEFALKDFGAGKNGAVNTAKLLELGKDNLNNLKDHSYFTFMDADKTQLKFSGYQDVTSEIKDKRISLAFTILLEKPINPRQQQVSYRIYDPSYYIEMKHLKKEGVVVGNDSTCKATVERPKPDIAFITMAAALDKKATAPDDLGRFFAERVSVQCVQ